MDRKLCIYGLGGFGREVLCCYIDSSPTVTSKNIDQYAVFMVDEPYYTEEKILGVSVIKRSDFKQELYEVVVAIGDPMLRKKAIDNLPKNTIYRSIIHPSAVISDWVSIGEGSIITAGTIITCDISIGKHAQLNLNTTVGHDCKIGDYFTSAPGTNISGKCNFGECVYLGSNVSIREGINICDNVVVGMGGVVVKDVVESGIYVGSPIKKLK